MKKYIILSISVSLLLSISSVLFAQENNVLTNQEKEQGWELLFNGKDFDGWRKCNGTSMPDNWSIEDEAMKVFLGEGMKEGQGAGGDILYAPKKFKNFELSIEWKAGEKGNSGIFYYVQEVPGKAIYFAARAQQTDRSDGKGIGPEAVRQEQ